MERITLKNRKGQNIVGLFEKPEGKIKGTAVLQHGWGGNKEKPTIQSVKRGFHDAGFQTFNFDATNTFGESDGDYEKSTLGLHWEDLEDVVKWAQKQEWFSKPLALSGHSKGGYAVARYVEEHPEEVDYLVPVGPVISGELSFAAARKRDPEALKKWEEEGVQISESNGVVKKKHWFQMEERLRHDLLPNAQNIKIPMLIIVGSEDTSCSPEHMQLLIDAVSSEDKQLHIIEGEPHSYYEKSEQDDCTQAITKWLSSRI